MSARRSAPAWARLLGGVARSVASSLRGGQDPRQSGGGHARRSGGAADRGRVALPRVDAPERLEGTESPGRFGPAATRDLTAAEIRSLRPSYSPSTDGDPDPGEVVWTWVPYEEHDGRGKDRPVLIIARIDDEAVAGCALSTKEHAGFVSVGSGAWDSQGRESFLSPERVLRVSNDGMRREGHVLGRQRFAAAVAVVARMHGFRAE
ncbi:hypothetical protein [Leucobacter sp. USHLN153]|uniref:hypothetical protein n=1 Tax=Leucobacter sp. USHLN153 TaxID=3081268 RepID=UPI00301A50F2